jgi:hypothetical protein
VMENSMVESDISFVFRAFRALVSRRSVNSLTQ